MADNEDESNMSSTITVGDHGTVSQIQCVSEMATTETQVSQGCDDKTVETATEVTTQGLTEFLQNCTKQGDTFVNKDGQVVAHIEGNEQQDQNIITSIVGTSGIATATEYSTMNAEFVNTLAPTTTTIIYVQPDGSFVEGSGLTAEEQQQLVEQLAKQQIVQVTESEAARLFEHNQVIKTLPATPQFVPSATLGANELQQVIDQVTKSQQQSLVQVSQQNQTVKAQDQVLATVDASGLFTAVSHADVVTMSPQPLTTVQNASQQLKNVAKHVALQSHNGTRLIQKKPEPIHIQVQMPPKQELKPMTTITIPQQKTLSVGQPQVKVSTNGSVGSPQIIHITPMVGQQQYFLQGNPGEPPIQLLLQSSTPVVGSLVPVVHKLPVQSQTSVTSVHAKVNVQTKVTTPAKTPVNGTAVKPAKPAAQPAAEKKKVKNKEKKPQPKIKTRSGRVSRPPKYKAKDYKFIKTEDLADGRQSDSDDYSEMSVEEEDGEEGKKGEATSSSSISYSHKQKAHKCETCDKAYIGHGGLNRHYKLNPTHGEETPSPTPDPQKADPPGKKAGAGADQKDSTVVKNEKEKADELTAASSSTSSSSSTTQQKADNTAVQGPAAAAGTRQIQCQVQPQAQPQLQHRGPGRPRGRGRGRGRPRGPPPKVVGLGNPMRRGRRGRPPKLGGASVEQLAQRRMERLKEVAQQCDNEELMEVVLPRLAKALTLWEFLLMKVEKGRPAKAHFPDVYREFEQLHNDAKRMAHDYITSPQGLQTALEVHNVEVAKSLGIFDEVNKMKVLGPGASQQSTTNLATNTKNVRYMENSKMLPPSKRFKMENSVSIQQNGIEKTANVKTCTVAVSPLVLPQGTRALPIPTPTTTPSVPPKQAPQATPKPTPKPQPLEASPDTSASITPMELIQDHLSNSMSGSGGPPEAMDTGGGGQGAPGGAEPCEQVLSTSEIADQMKELEKALATDPLAVDPQPRSSSGQEAQQLSAPVPQSTPAQAATAGAQVVVQEGLESQAGAPESQAGQEIYIQTEGLTMHLAEGSEGGDLTSERIVIVNGPDGTTMHIRAPEGVPLEAVHALLGIEAEAAKTAQQ